MAVELKEYLSAFVKSAGGVSRAAALLDVHANVVHEVLIGKRVKLPSYCLKKIGLKQVVTLVPIDEKA